MVWFINGKRGLVRGERAKGRRQGFLFTSNLSMKFNLIQRKEIKELDCASNNEKDNKLELIGERRRKFSFFPRDPHPHSAVLGR